MLAVGVVLALDSWGYIHIDTGRVMGFIIDHWILVLVAWLLVEAVAQWLDSHHEE